jgi:hypothetical protein
MTHICQEWHAWWTNLDLSCLTSQTPFPGLGVLPHPRLGGLEDVGRRFSRHGGKGGWVSGSVVVASNIDTLRLCVAWTMFVLCDSL